MNKVLALAVSLIINGIVQFINYRSFAENNHLKICHRMHGGEITIENGFGYFARHIYGMSIEDKTTHSLVFSWPLFLISVLIVAVLIYVIMLVIGKRR